MKATIVGFKRGLRQQKISEVRITPANLKHCVKKPLHFLGKKVLFLNKKSSRETSKIIWGKITKLHGRSGSFIARFKKNIPPSAISETVHITLLPC